MLPLSEQPQHEVPVRQLFIMAVGNSQDGLLLAYRIVPQNETIYCDYCDTDGSGDARPLSIAAHDTHGHVFCSDNCALHFHRNGWCEPETLRCHHIRKGY